MEISSAFGFASPNAAEDHLKALAKKGNKLGMVGVNEQPRSLMERSGFAQHLHTFL